MVKHLGFEPSFPRREADLQSAAVANAARTPLFLPLGNTRHARQIKYLDMCVERARIELASISLSRELLFHIELQRKHVLQW